MSEEKRELVRRAVAALSDETRYRLVKCLMEEGPSSAGELAVKLDKARSTIDEHLEELLEAGLVVRRRLERKFLYEATELARLCIEFLEGRGSVEEVVEALPDRVEVKVEVVEAKSRLGLKWLLSNPPAVALLAVLAALALKPVAPPFELGLTMVALGLGYGLADVKGVLRVERKDLVSACVVAAFVTALAACFVVKGHLILETLLVGFAWYLAIYVVCSFTFFEAVRLVWRR